MQQIMDMIERFGNMTGAYLHLLSTRRIYQFRRKSKQVLDAVSKLPRGVGTLLTVLFLAMTLTYSLVLGGQGRTMSENIASASGFSINAIKLTGQREVGESEILNALDIRPNSSLLLYSVHKAMNRIVGLPWVEGASVQKLYPNTLKVVIREKEPFALWRRNGRISIIDRQGEVITDNFSYRFAGLPLVLGHGANENAKKIVSALAQLPELNAQVSVRHFVSGRRWNLILSNGMTVQLPESGIIDALSEFNGIVQDNDLFEKDIVRIDMRLDDRIVFRLSEDAFANWKAAKEAADSSDKGDADT